MLERRKSCIEHRKDTESLTDDVHDLKSAVFGNGQKGIKERVTIMETNFSAVGKSITIGATILGILQIAVGIMIVFFNTTAR